MMAELSELNTAPGKNTITIALIWGQGFLSVLISDLKLVNTIVW